MSIGSPRVTPEGDAEVPIRLGDQYVTLAAHEVVEALKAPSDRIRAIIGEHFEHCADEGATDAMSRVYAALAVLVAEIRAEEVRAVNAATDGLSFE